MICLHIRELMNQGFAISNKIYFNELGEGEFDNWVAECKRLLSWCEPQPEGFPAFTDHRHIQEIVFLLRKVKDEISKGEITYSGLL